MSVNVCALADAMCCGSESQIRIASSRRGAGVDLSTDIVTCRPRRATETSNSCGEGVFVSLKLI